ncbi:unnamed protein product [Merluccius merluccius]
MPGCSMTVAKRQWKPTDRQPEPSLHCSKTFHNISIVYSLIQRHKAVHFFQVHRTVTEEHRHKHIVAVFLWSLSAYNGCMSAKPISLVERCWCRSTLNTVPQRSIKELMFLHTPNCPFQVIAKLKNNREVCINPETKWLQQYLKNAINK